MLLRMQLASIADHRELIEGAIKEIAPNYTDTLIIDAYTQLLLGTYQVWVHFKNSKPEMLVITSINIDQFTKDNILTIIGIYAPDGTDFNMWNKIIAGLKPFAEKHNCEKYDFLMTNPNIWHYIEGLKPTLEGRYCQINF